MAGSIPSEIAAGITLRMSLALPEYPAPDWSLSLILRGPEVIDLSWTGSGEDHTYVASGLTTGGWSAGTYWWQLRATDGEDVVLVEEGQTRVLTNLAAVDAGFDGRSHAEKVLAAVEAVIEGRASIDQQSYSINNRSLTRTPIAELLKLRAVYRAQVQAQKSAKSGARLGRIHRVRFK